MTQARCAFLATLRIGKFLLFFNKLTRLSHAWDNNAEEGLGA